MAYNASSGSRNFGDIRFEDDTDTQLDWSADSITFKTNDVARFVINNDGIGIGVANPSSSLDVEGNVTIGATFSGKNAAPTNGLIVEQSVGVGQASPASDNSTTHFVHIGSSSSDSSGLVLQDNEGKWEIYNNGWLVIKDGTESIAYFKHTGNKEMVLTKNLQMLADSTVLSFGAGEDVTFTHDGGTGMDIVSAGSLDIGSTAGSMTIGSVLADGQTLKLGKNGAVETIIAPHGTAGSEKYSVTNTAGTAVGPTAAAIQLAAAAGGIGIRSTANLEGCIQIEADGGTDETISIHSDQGTGHGTDAASNASINLISDSGGIALSSGRNGGSAVLLEENGGTDGQINIHADTGLGRNSAGNASAASISIYSDGGGIGLYSGNDNDNAIRLETNGGAGETIVIHSNQGTGEGTSNASIQLLSDVGGIDLTATGLTGVMTDGNSDAAVQISALAGGIGLRTTSDLAGSIQIEADGGTSETIIIKSDQGTGLDSIQLVSDAGGVTIAADTTTFSSANAQDPLVIIKNTTSDASGARLRFVKDKGAAGADGDDIGIIEFVGDDAAQTQTTFARIVAEVSEADDTDEAGKLSFYVAESDGTTTTLTAGLVLEGEHATDGEVDVTIGAGATSLTTIAGDLDIPNGCFALDGDASGDMYYRNATGILTRIGVGSDNHVLTLDGAVPGWEAAPAASSLAADDITVGDAAVSIATSVGNVTVDSQAGSVTVDGHTGVNIVSSNSGEVDITSAANIDVNVTTDISLSGSALDVDVAGALAIDSTYGSITLGAILADGQTLKLGKNGAVETIIAPHGTAGSELYSVINTAGITDGSDAAGSILLSSVAGGIGLAWADDKDLWAEGGRAVITANEDAADCIKLHADAGSSQTITVVNDAGTSVTEGSAAVQLTSTAGGVGVRSAANLANAVNITADGGTSSTITIFNDQGTSVTEGAESIALLSDAGGIGIRSTANLANAVNITADGGTSSTITLFNDQGTSVTEGAESIALLSDAGGIGIRSTADLANAVNITADGGTSSTITVFNDQGTAATEGAASIQLLSDVGGINIKSGLDAANAILLTADGGTSETIVLHSDQGTGLDSIKLLSDAGGVTVAADTTTFESANSTDPLVIIKNTTDDANGARLRFVKDRGGAGAANDVAGLIEFYADDANQDQVKFSEIKSQVKVHTNGQEGGKFTVSVAEHDGTTTAGLVIEDGDADGELDVLIGAGTASLTTIAGDLDIPNGCFALDGDASGDMYYRNSSGVLTRIAVGSDNHVLTLDGVVPGWEAASGGGSGDVSAGSTFTTAGVIMACTGADKTIDDPAATLTTNGQDMTIEGGDLVLGLAANTNATTIAPVASSGNDAGKTLTISAGNSTIGANDINGGDLILKTGGGDGTGTASIQFWSKVSGTDAAAERMRIGVNGNVGINETTPKTTLSVTHDYNSTTFETQLSDGEGGGRIMKYSPGADDTLTVGQLYFLHTDGTWDACDADAVATGASQLLGVGMGAARAVGVLLEGFVRIPSTEILNTPGSGAVDGLPVYVSTTAGHFDFTAPSGAGDFVRVVGYAIDDDSSDVLVYFNPDSTWVEL